MERCVVFHCWPHCSREFYFSDRPMAYTSLLYGPVIFILTLFCSLHSRLSACFQWSLLSITSYDSVYSLPSSYIGTYNCVTTTTKMKFPLKCKTAVVVSEFPSLKACLRTLTSLAFTSITPAGEGECPPE